MLFRRIVTIYGAHKTETRMLNVRIKPGAPSGTVISFAKLGDALPGHIPADIHFVVMEKPHRHFTREGAHLRHTRRLSRRDANALVAFPTIHGPELRLLVEDRNEARCVKR
jgi:DnaJ-class molecular chaperone